MFYYVLRDLGDDVDVLPGPGVLLDLREVGVHGDAAGLADGVLAVAALGQPAVALGQVLPGLLVQDLVHLGQDLGELHLARGGHGDGDGAKISLKRAKDEIFG